jgi:hypothetical protein
VRFAGLDLVDERWSEVETLVDQTPGADPWCSGPDWVLAAHQAFAPDDQPLIVTNFPDQPGRPTDGSAGPGPTAAPLGCLLLAHYETYEGGEAGFPWLAGLEPLWGFANPILGVDPSSLLADAIPLLTEAVPWRALILPGQPSPWESGDDQGLPLDPSSPTVRLAATLSSFGQVGLGEGITRRTADLSEGFDAWWQRRSSKFRRNLLKARSTAHEAGLRIEPLPGTASAVSPVSPASPDRPAAESGEVFDRLLRIEQRSWKGAEGSGIAGADMGTFYRLLIARLQARGRFHGYVARLAEQDVGFIIGGIRNRRYRGLQLSYDAQAGQLGIGNLLQLHQIEQLCLHDQADVYDLGMDFDYKRRWADAADTSVSLILRR